MITTISLYPSVLFRDQPCLGNLSVSQNHEAIDRFVSLGAGVGDLMNTYGSRKQCEFPILY